jgi:hypothetical protein
MQDLAVHYIDILLPRLPLTAFLHLQWPEDHNQLHDRHPEAVGWLTRTSDTFPTVQQIKIGFKGGV